MTICPVGVLIFTGHIVYIGSSLDNRSRFFSFTYIDSDDTLPCRHNPTRRHVMFYALKHRLQYVDKNTRLVVSRKTIHDAPDLARKINQARGGFASNAWGGAAWTNDYVGPFETYNGALGYHQRQMDIFKVRMKAIRKRRKPYRLSYDPGERLVG